MSDYTGIRTAVTHFGDTHTCVAVALAAVLDIDYSHARVYCNKFGMPYKGRGMPTHKSHECYASLGIKRKTFIDPYVGETTNLYKPNSGSRYTPRTIGEAFPKGRYILRMKGHVAALVNGVVIDWTSGRCSRILEIYEVP